ncbi:unnamed protein product [Blepharisma stoltei]|uniref:Aldehyde dehydrogenase domain-containing protein n=1 Tax=Blepharisma stoltei TaxID=1481888 RepID=A0AAU9K472_9CILI|nr:unnamed protein product [Blepharisma stoltei]
MLNNLARRFSSRYQTHLLINNQWVKSSSHSTFQTINPATEEVIAEVQRSNEEDVNKAVKAARNAFDNGPWRRMSGRERGALLHNLAHLMTKHQDDLAKLETIDNGKPISDSKNIDVPLAIQCYEYYAGAANNIRGSNIPITGPYLCYTRKEPKGVAGQIIPWNFPLLMQSWKLGPALAAGCTVILKPAELTPLSALKVGELIVEAGFPEGVVNILPGYGDAGAAMVVHPDIDKIAFTGSTEVGLEIMRNASTGNLKRVTLELGGKSPNIVLDDADMDCAIAQAHIGLFLNQGQCCIAGSRLFVQESIYEKFLEKIVESAKTRVLGDPLDPKTTQGPQIDHVQFKKILGYITKGKQEGAKLLLGGNRWGKKGYFIEPTIFADVTDNMTIAREEIFGPVMNILKFKTIDEVIQRANNSQYGLGAGVHTRDIEKALKITNSLRTGTVYVNCYDVFRENTPFGGYKNSGVGRELGEQGLENYLESKTVIVKTSNDTLP